MYVVNARGMYTREAALKAGVANGRPQKWPLKRSSKLRNGDTGILKMPPRSELKIVIYIFFGVCILLVSHLLS